MEKSRASVNPPIINQRQIEAAVKILKFKAGRYKVITLNKCIMFMNTQIVPDVPVLVNIEDGSGIHPDLY